MATQFFAIGYVNRGVKIHAVTADGPLCGTARINRFRSLPPPIQVTCRRCLQTLGRGDFRYDANAVPVALRHVNLP